MTLSPSYLFSDLDTLHDLVLGARADHLFDAVAADIQPREVLAFGRVDVMALQQRFPRADILLGHLDRPDTWGCRPDLVVAMFALTQRGIDVPLAVAELWSALPEGGRMVALDLDRVRYARVREGLCAALDLDLDRPVLQVLRRNFVPLHVTRQQRFGGLWSTLGFIGRRGMDWPSPRA